MVDVGITLQPERRYLDLVTPLAEAAADYVEVAPETLWRRDADDRIVPNGFHREIAAFVASTKKPVVAHGTGLSLGSAHTADDERAARWIERIAADHETFRFAWYTDHLGVTTLAGRVLGLPIALPHTAEAAALVRRRLAMLQQVVPDVGFENTVFYFLLGDWLREPEWIAHALDLPRAWLLLDLHNVFTTAWNLDADPRAWLERIDLSRVLEIHVSGGRDSDPAWLPDRSTLRLDSHDDGVPEPVWELLAEWAPRCPNLRGVTVERMEGTVDAADVATLERELARAREVLVGG